MYLRTCWAQCLLSKGVSPLAEELAQAVAIGRPVGDGVSCYTARYGSLRYRSGDPLDEPTIDRLRDEVFGTERQAIQPIDLLALAGEGHVWQLGAWAR